MGGDHGADVTIPAAVAFARAHADAQLLLVGRQQELESRLAGLRTQDLQLRVIHAEEVVAMDEPPAQALRGKRNSSMRIAINQVKDGAADVCISAGNTGALMAISRFVLKTLEGIDRPAIASVLPNQRGGVTTMLDLGANVDCSPENLVQFAVMGSALVSAVEDKKNPSVGLLNIGEELIKGNDVVKRAAEMLRNSSLNFYGNVEGDDIFKGTTDVVVCDGFVGNAVLKAAEGFARLLAGMVKEEFTRNPLTKLQALLSYSVLNHFRRRVDPRNYNGASLLGLRGIVIKSHGSADVHSFECAIKRGYDEARHGLLDRTEVAMRPFLNLIKPDAATSATDR